MIVIWEVSCWPYIYILYIYIIYILSMNLESIPYIPNRNGNIRQELCRNLSQYRECRSIWALFDQWNPVILGYISLRYCWWCFYCSVPEFTIPWKSHETPMNSHKIPWNFLESPMKSHKIPWNFHEMLWKCHEIPWNPIKSYNKNNEIP